MVFAFAAVIELALVIVLSRIGSTSDRKEGLDQLVLVSIDVCKDNSLKDRARIFNHQILKIILLMQSTFKSNVANLNVWAKELGLDLNRG